MITLNKDNGAHDVTIKYAEKALQKFGNPIGAELGIAWGGGVEAIGKLWKGSEGIIYGFDTFEGHPRHLSYSQNAHEAYCMQPQYDGYGMDKLSIEYQQKQLDKQNLKNVILVKGLINDNSFKDAGITELHYCLLDLDMINPMTLAWTLVRPVMAKGGYLCLHDVTPREHIIGLWGLYQEILATGEYRLVVDNPKSYIVVLEKL